MEKHFAVPETLQNPRSAFSDRSWKELMARLLDIKERRRRLMDEHGIDMARTTGERDPGLISFAAPVFDGEGAVVLVVTPSGLATTISTAWGGPVPHALRCIAQELTTQIGGRSGNAPA